MNQFIVIVTEIYKTDQLKVSIQATKRMFLEKIKYTIPFFKE